MTSQSQDRVVASPTHRLRRALVWSSALALAIIVTVGLALQYERGSLNDFLCEGPCGPAYVASPEGLEAPAADAPAVSAAAGTTADPEAVTAAVNSALNQPVLGSHVGVSVRQLDGVELVATSADSFIPASTTKLLTGFAALTTLDPEHRFVTSTVLDGDRLILVGGGDPFLMATQDDRGFAAPATLETLAARTADALHAEGIRAVDLGYDDTLFTGPAENPTWEPSYAEQNVVSPISALWVDRGQIDGVRSAEPAASAAEIFAGQLAAEGISVTPVGRTSASGDATPVGEVRGPTVAQAVERVELTSDNGGAEVLARHVALASGSEASFVGAVGAVEQALSSAGIDTTGLVLRDGSGLSRENRISPSLLTRVAAAATVSMPTLVDVLPVAGFSGSLADRFAGLAGRGMVRAKTGSLNQVHSLAGTVTTADGVVLTMAVMTDSADAAQPLAGRAAIDALLASLASCTCAQG
ncbi:MAG: D-alanyl-D-alanine carboxypeptidase/D-alanyl-D-alanine-endopeptidase [Aeromicrobium sp.]|uniref:D-alanyl-D-alanine carboxypeptidase/D-alanyl-D-alanine endopeptidase n=1 Tax=Aeromicrobium sp. TaxID=1871063 RepID=UPI0039E345D4